MLVQSCVQSSTLKSYVSAIKTTLVDDGYLWDDNKLILNTLTHACKAINDRVTTRLPIHKGLVELILFEIKRMFTDQPVLETMYTAWFLLAYYGLFRVGELAFDDHMVKAKDVHIGINKNKLLFILYTSMD